MADPRTYIRVHDGMPDHPKVDGLSDRAFRLLVESWCWCSRHLTDGAMPSATWRKRGTAQARKELVDAHLVEVTPGGVMFHDYLEHQRSAEDVREIREARERGGSFGNHVRWHVRRGRVDPDCDHCTDRKPVAPPIANGSQDRSQTDRKTSPETETETDLSGGSVGGSSSVADAHASDDDRDHKIDRQIIAQLAKLTGQTVTAEWAAHVRANILTGRAPHDPAAYVAAAIRGAPHDHLPTDGHPSNRTLAEALARGQCEHGDPRGPDVCPLCRRGIPPEE